MKIRPLPPQQRLRELLDYDPKSGTLTWRFRPEARSQWNGRFAGEPALTTEDGNGYRRGRLLGQVCLAHRVIWKWMTGEEPPEIDHRDGSPSNNRWFNLRSASRTVNCRNARLYKRNTSGVCGVRWDRQIRKWHARIGASHLGYFAAFGDAVAARLAAQQDLGFSDRHGT